MVKRVEGKVRHAGERVEPGATPHSDRRLDHGAALVGRGPERAQLFDESAVLHGHWHSGDGGAY
jgi:hypothetical protein